MTPTPSIGNGDFGMSPFCGQLSGKPVLAVNVYLGYRDQSTRTHRTFKLQRRPRTREMIKLTPHSATIEVAPVDSRNSSANMRK
jgi:hypothetical protein